MKALAAEMVRNFGGRLAPLGIQVKELTGDMQLTKTEIMKTQVRLIMSNSQSKGFKTMQWFRGGICLMNVGLSVKINNSL